MPLPNREVAAARDQRDDEVIAGLEREVVARARGFEVSALYDVLGELGYDYDASLGDGIKRAAPSEIENLPLIRRSLVASRSLRKGERVTRDMISIKRPATGIAPDDIEKVLGKRLICDLEDDEPITWSNLTD